MDLPDPGIEPGSPALQADSSPSELPGKPQAPGFHRKECCNHLPHLPVVCSLAVIGIRQMQGYLADTLPATAVFLVQRFRSSGKADILKVRLIDQISGELCHWDYKHPLYGEGIMGI